MDYPGDYRIEFSMSSGDSAYNKAISYAETAMVTFQTGTPEPISLSAAGQKKTLAVSVPGWENLPVAVASWNEPSDGLLKVELEGDNLALTANHAGSGTLSVQVNMISDSASGQGVKSWTISYPVSVGG